MLLPQPRKNPKPLQNKRLSKQHAAKVCSEPGCRVVERRVASSGSAALYTIRTRLPHGCYMFGRVFWLCNSAMTLPAHESSPLPVYPRPVYPRIAPKDSVLTSLGLKESAPVPRRFRRGDQSPERQRGVGVGSPRTRRLRFGLRKRPCQQPVELARVRLSGARMAS